MPTGQMIYKAGKLTFLLVCLFLCTACGEKKAVFEAGTQPSVKVHIQEETAQKEADWKEFSETAKEVPTAKLVNINTADAAELMTLPGIGEVRAAAIIEHRKDYGEFQKVEDIMNVKGIKTGIFSKISSLICVK